MVRADDCGLIWASQCRCLRHQSPRPNHLSLRRRGSLPSRFPAMERRRWPPRHSWRYLSAPAKSDADQISRAWGLRKFPSWCRFPNCQRALERPSDVPRLRHPRPPWLASAFGQNARIRRPCVWCHLPGARSCRYTAQRHLCPRRSSFRIYAVAFRPIAVSEWADF